MLISNLLAYSQLYQYVGKPKFIIDNFQTHIIHSAILFLPSVASAIYLQVDKVMIELMTGRTAEVSYYDYSEKLVTIPLTFITVLSTVMMPRIANEFHKGNKEKIAELINVAARFSIFIACPMVFGLIAISDKLIPWYLGDEFLGTAVAMSIISPIILTNTLTGISGNQYFTATNQVDILLKSQVATAVLNVIVNAMLIPKFGFIGAAIATVLSSFLNACIQFRYLAKQVKMTGFIRDLIVHLFLGLIMFVAIRVITQNMSATPITNVIQVLVGVLVYFCAAIIIRDKQLLQVLERIKNHIK